MSISIGEFSKQYGYQNFFVGAHTTTQLPALEKEFNPTMTNTISHLKARGGCQTSARSYIKNHFGNLTLNAFLNLERCDIKNCYYRQFEKLLITYLKAKGVQLNHDDYPEGSLGRAIAEKLAAKP